MDNSQRIDNVLNKRRKPVILQGMQPSFTPYRTACKVRIWALLLAAIGLGSGCNRDHEAPSISVSEPASDGQDLQFDDLFFVEFEVTDDQEDGGIWRVELRGGDGVSVRTAQAGIWEGQSTGTLVTAFHLNAPSWPTSEMVLAVVADDAAGNRAAIFRDFDYTGQADVPSIWTALVSENNGTASVLRTDANGAALPSWTGLPESHSLAYSGGTLALADTDQATVHLVDWSTGEVFGAWEDPTVDGAAPLIRRLRPLGIQAGFAIAHATGIVAIDPSGALLFERFTEAPWTPVDVVFDGVTCVAWEENPASGNHRLRSWDFQTGATGLIVNLAYPPQGWGAVGNQDGGTAGNVFFISDESGLTLCETATGQLNDLCSLLGSNAVMNSPYSATDSDQSMAVFGRGDAVHRQAMAPVTSGSSWPVPGTLAHMSTDANGDVHLLVQAGASVEIWRWRASDAAPEFTGISMPENTLKAILVND